MTKGTEALFPAPESMDDPLRSIWYRIHHDEVYEPTNAEARYVCARLSQARNERDTNIRLLSEALKFTRSVYGWAVHEPNTKRLNAEIERLHDGAVLHGGGR